MSSARVRVELRDLAYSSCEDPLTRAFGRGGTPREIRDVKCGWCASGRPLVCSRVGDRGAPSREVQLLLNFANAITRSSPVVFLAYKMTAPERSDPTRARGQLPAWTRHPADERACPRVFDQNQRCVKSQSQSPSRSPPRRPQTLETARDLAWVSAMRAGSRTRTAGARPRARREIHGTACGTACTSSTSRRAAMRAPAGARGPQHATSALASTLLRPF